MFDLSALRFGDVNTLFIITIPSGNVYVFFTYIHISLVVGDIEED